MPISNGDTVRVQNHSGEFLATVLTTNKHTDPDNNQLYKIKITKIIAQPNYALKQNDTLTIYPEEATLE